MSKIVKSIGEIDRKFTKTDLVELAKQHATEIIGNEKYDLLKVYIELKRYEVYLNTLIKEVKEETTQKAKAETEQSFEYANAKVAYSQYRKFDYSADATWNQLDQEVQEVKQLKKEREELLKSVVGESKEFVNEETGEIETLLAPLIEYVETVRVKL